MNDPKEQTTQVESPVERVKRESRFLRGTLTQSLAEPWTGALRPDDTHICKFHGLYQQDDRDVRNERTQKKLEPHYQFMARVRIPGGALTPAQWLGLDQLAREYGGGTLRLTTRQTVQVHGILKRNLKTAMQEIHSILLTTIAACGDVCRNVMCTANPHLSPVHEQVLALARQLSLELSPNTGAYHEIWLDGNQVYPSRAAQEVQEEEPLYGATYLPRKFKIAIAVPPDNDVDLFTQDLGFAAHVQEGRLVGFDVFVGGGMGRTHGDKTTYPRLASSIGYCQADQAVAVARAVLLAQRDHGNRAERHHARLKYTIDRHGVDWFRQEVEKRLPFPLQPAKGIAFATMGDRHGWTEDHRGLWHLTLHLLSGRVSDTPSARWMTALRALAQTHQGEFRLTGNQNLIVSGVRAADRAGIERLLASHGIALERPATRLRLHALSCVAFPTCGLAMAESERYLPTLLDKLEPLLTKHGLDDDAITIRMTGCPNGCARPYNAEIALVGRAPGRYDLYLGAAFAGHRLNRLFRENIDEALILEILSNLFARYAVERTPDEHFGDFALRTAFADAPRT